MESRNKPRVEAGQKRGRKQQRTVKQGLLRGKEPGKSIYNVGEAKTHLSEILRHVEGTGEEVVLTNRGKRIARIIPDQGAAGVRQLGFARGEIRLLRGWDQPVMFDEFGP